MKFYQLFLFVVVFITPFEHVRCQTDSAKMIAYYDFVVNDSIERTTEQFMLAIGSKISVFKSLDKYLSDSVSRLRYEQVRVGNNIFVKPGDPSAWKYTTTQIYRVNNENRFITIDNLLLITCWMDEPENAIDWEIHPDTLSINGLPSQKATANFKGRDYEAWFTLAVPYPFGPWKLGGLPGLIVKARDLKNEFMFVLAGLSSTAQEQDKRKDIVLPARYSRITQTEFINTYSRMRENPMQFVEAQTDMKVSIRGAENMPVSKVRIPKLYRIEIKQ